MKITSRIAKVLVPLVMLIGVVAPMASAGASGLTPQTIDFGPVTHITYNVVGSKWYVHASGGASGNPVVFTIDQSSTSGCTINASTDVVTFSAPTGTCVIDANQAGNTTYAAAPQLQIVATYSLPAQLVEINTNVPTLRIGMTYQFTASDKGNGSNNPIVFSKGSLSSQYPESGCTIAANGLATFSAPTGYCTVIAKQAGNSEYAAGQAGWSFMVHPASSGGTTTTTTTPGTTTSTGATSLTISYINKSIGLDKTSKSQLNALAATIKQGGLRLVTVNSYVNKGGTVRSSNILSKHEASNVASYLKSRLAALHVSGVSFRVVGHGATSFIATPTSLNNRRTEVVASS